jgi:2'-hydroxyisoflavone reductase
MKILILGGTIFFGRQVTEQAIARGHDVTLFNRGQHFPELFPDVEKLQGDRDGGLEVLRGRQFDAVIDTSGQIPRTVRDSVNLLRDSADHYTFISSLSVFSDFSKIGINENDPVGTLEDESVEQVTNETYGPMKALCEEHVRNGMPDGALVIRPGLIVGPFDWSDRFSYWPLRVERGGRVLAPDDPQAAVQIIDVRDLAAWNLDMVEAGKTGTYNATGPEKLLTMAEVLEESRRVTGSGAEFVWVDKEFLREHEVQPWMQMPLWVGGDKEAEGFGQIDCSRAIAEGLRFRPLADTIRATLDWWHEYSSERPLRAGISAERERELLQAWG